MGNYNEAVADLEKVLELTNGNSSDASRQLAITYNQLGIELYSAREYQKALDVFQLAIKNDDKSASIFINRGDCHREMHQVGTRKGSMLFCPHLFFDPPLTAP